MNKCLLLLLGAVALLLGACICPGTWGSGNVVSETRDVSGFDRVLLWDSGELNITQGAAESLTVEAEDNVIGRVTTDVRGDTLEIGFKGGWWWPFRPSGRVVYDLTVKELSGLEVSGSANQLDLEVSGSGDVEIERLDADRLVVDSSGSGRFEMSGQVAVQEVKISGSGKYEAEALQSEAVTLEISGSGSATVWATDSLDVKISGSGRVDYYGSPRVNQEISGSGRITGLDDGG
jgi:hypothetical protein